MKNSVYKIIPERLAQLDMLQLDTGKSDAWENGHCALEVAAWLVGEPHTDEPQCVDPYIAAFVRRWNDGIGSMDRRTELLRPLLPLLVGTGGGSDELMARRIYMCIDWDIRTRAPVLLRLAKLDDAAAKLEALPKITSQAVLSNAHAVIMAVLASATASWDATRYAAWDATLDATWGATWDAALDAALDATRSATWDAVWDATWDDTLDAAKRAAGYAAKLAARDAARYAANLATLDAARYAAVERLRPAVEAVQISAQDLVRRMCEVANEAPVLA